MGKPEDVEAEVAKQRRLIGDHVEAARNIARGLARRYAWLVDANDIAGIVMVGLCEAARRFDRSRAEPFLAFAEQRIRGAVLDEIRRLGGPGRVIHRRQRRISAVRHELTQSGHEATDDRVASELGLSLAAVQSAGARVVRASCDEVLGLPAPGASPEARVAGAEVLLHLLRACDTLTFGEAAIIRLRYEVGLSLAQIARTSELTLGRVRHLHATALARLRAAMPAAAGECDMIPYVSVGELEASCVRHTTSSGD